MLGFRGQFNYADCSAMLMPASYAMERPHKLVVGGPAAGTVASAHFGSFIDKQNLLCADVGGTSCDISVVLNGRAVGQRHVRARVGPRRQRALHRDRDPGRRRRFDRRRSARRVSCGSAPRARVPIPVPRATAKGGTAPTITDAALLDRHPRPGSLRRRQGAARTRTSRATRSRRSTRSMPLSERIRQAWLIGLHNIAEGIIDITIRRGLDVRDLSSDRLRRGRADDAARPPRLLPLGSVIVPPNPGGFSALGLLSSDRVFSESRTRYGILGSRVARRTSRSSSTGSKPASWSAPG